MIHRAVSIAVLACCLANPSAAEDVEAGEGRGGGFYKELEAGWLLSPQYRDNERLFEIRYVWRPAGRLSVDVRGRWRDELRQRIIEDPDRDRFDFYARFTWSFALKE